MNGEWVLANKCPHCGGRMTIVDFYSYSRDYPILKTGDRRSMGKSAEKKPLEL